MVSKILYGIVIKSYDLLLLYFYKIILCFLRYYFIKVFFTLIINAAGEDPTHDVYKGSFLFAQRFIILVLFITWLRIKMKVL